MNERETARHHNYVELEDPDHESYDINHLFDSVLDQLQLRDDTALADALEIAPSLISDMRNMRFPLDAAMLVRIHELTDISVAGLRNILGDRRKKLRFPDGTEGADNLIRETQSLGPF